MTTLSRLYHVPLDLIEAVARWWYIHLHGDVATSEDIMTIVTTTRGSREAPELDIQTTLGLKFTTPPDVTAATGGAGAGTAAATTRDSPPF